MDTSGRTASSGPPEAVVVKMGTKAGFSGWMQLAKKNVKEWVLLFAMIGVLIYTEYGAYGRRMHITDDMLEKIKFPHLESTVPSWTVPVYTLVGPPLVIIGHSTYVGHPVAVTHSACLGGIFSTALSALLTNLFKITVGRPRPDFFYRCWPDGVVKWKEVHPDGRRKPDCSPNAIDVRDGYKSFPSGHTSWSFGALTFLSLYLLFYLRLHTGATDIADIVVVLLPFMMAAWVGMTRVVDHYHNPSDVVAGGLLGILVAGVTYFIHFPYGRLPKEKVLVEAPMVPARSSQADLLPV